MRRPSVFTGCLLVIAGTVSAVIAAAVIARTGIVDTLTRQRGDCVAVIEVEGLITESRQVIKKFLEHKNNENVKAIVIRIDSPGGAVGPSQEIYEELMKYREVKPIVASMGSVAASGGYYIASAAHKIVANAGTVTGSIGVIIEVANVEELLEKIGLKSVVLKSGKYKDILSPTRELETDERSLVQGVIDDIHAQFVDAVALGRGAEREKIASIADGRIFSGRQAQESGLVDELGNLQTAIDCAAGLARIDGEPAVIYPEKKRPSIWEFLIDSAMQNLQKFAWQQHIQPLFIPSSR